MDIINYIKLNYFLRTRVVYIIILVLITLKKIKFLKQKLIKN